MSNRFISRLVAFFILIGLPFGFFFFYKNKIDALPSQAKQVPTFWAAPNFKYATQDGDSLSSDDLRGKVYVADFIFTNCDGVCPNLSQAMSLIQLNFKDDDRLRLVSFSVDPDRDSIPVLNAYAKRFGATSKKWYLLRGDKNVVWKMAEEGFKVPVVYTPEGGAGNEFTHTEKMVLVDADGKIRGFYNGLDKENMDSLYNSIARLLVSMKRT
jgi:protein SCO1/2